MSVGAGAMKDVYAKLEWARRHLGQMHKVFGDFAKPGGGEDRPYGINFIVTGHTAGSIAARFVAEQAMPVEMSLLAADVVHNARTALEHVLARLKEYLGGDPGAGYFPTRLREDLWQKHVINARNSPLEGLPPAAVALIYGEQPLHRPVPAADPLVILNRLDNDDKHELMHPAWAAPLVARGLDMAFVSDRSRLIREVNCWRPGQPLEHGSRLAYYWFDGPVGPTTVRVRDDVNFGFATGPVDGHRTSYDEMIDRVWGVADKAAVLIDSFTA